MPIRVDAGRSPLPRQAIHRAADVYDRVDELEVQSAVTRWVRNALANRELEQTAEAIEVGVKARYFAEGLGVHSALEACTTEAPAEHFATGAARVSSKGIEPCEVLFIDAKRHDAGLLLLSLQTIDWLGLHLAPLQRARRSKTARANSRDSACRELERTLRANAPKVSAVGMSPTSALPCVVSRSILPVGKAFSRKCFSSCFDSGSSGSGFL